MYIYIYVYLGHSFFNLIYLTYARLFHKTFVTLFLSTNIDA